MKVAEAIDRLKAKADPKTRAIAINHGAPEDAFGTKMGEIRAVAKEIKTDHALALELWKSGNFEAKLLAILVMKPKELSADQLDKMVRQASCGQLADWFNSYIVKNHPGKDSLREKWMDDSDPWAARAGWSLTADKVVKDASGLDLAALLDRIETEMPQAPEPSQWTMNFTLGYIGINHPALRERTLAIGERVGLYRDWPVSKGCVPPFVPVWVNEMVSRQS